MSRIEEICSLIDSCDTFADIGCDHGYCTEAVLKGGKARSAIIADISPKSLQKAEILLEKHIAAGVVRSVCCDGLSKIPQNVNQVLIAGMGGMEIIKILKEGFIPDKFVFQPMKNAPELRAFLLENGCKIVKDDIFFDENYYFVIKGEKTGGTKAYSPLEIFFGRDSLTNRLFKAYAEAELTKKLAYLSGIKADSNADKMKREIQFLREALNADR